MEKTLGPSWGSLAWRGVGSIVFGVIALASPAITMAALVILFSAYMVADGVLALGLAVSPGETPHRWLLFLDGVLGLVAGIVTLLWPGIGLVTLLFIVALRALASGVVQMVAAWQLRSSLSTPWLYGIGGALTVAFGIAVLVYPAISAFVLVTTLGIYALIFGVAFLGLAYTAHRSSERTFSGAVPH